MNKEQVGIIIFSRMSSSRLPGKALKALGGITLLERVIKRAKLTGFPVYLATSNENSDDVLEEIAHQNNIGCYRGSLNNVLERGFKAAQYFELKAFARLCGDRPLFSIGEMKTALTHFQISQRSGLKLDIITNFINGVKIKGLTTEVISIETLSFIMNSSPSASHLEHLSSYIYEFPSLFNILCLKRIDLNYQLNNYAIDTIEDFQLFNDIFSVDPVFDLSIQNADIIFKSLKN